MFMGSRLAICYHKSTKPPPLQGTCNFLTLTPLSYQRFFYHWLNLLRVFNRHLTMISRGYIPFCSSNTSFVVLVNNQLIDNFVHCQQSTLKSHKVLNITFIYSFFLSVKTKHAVYLVDVGFSTYYKSTTQLVSSLQWAPRPTI